MKKKNIEKKPSWPLRVKNPQPREASSVPAMTVLTPILGGQTGS